MPKIRDCLCDCLSHIPPCTLTFEFNLVKNHWLDYCKNREESLNWFPVDIKLIADNELNTFSDTPTLSLEGINYLLKQVDTLVFEKKECPKKIRTSSFDDFDDYRVFEYFATEADFHMTFQNNYDNSNGDVVLVNFWFNMASCGGSFAYHKGYRFHVFLKEFDDFFKEIKAQLYELTDGNEGEPIT